MSKFKGEYPLGWTKEFRNELRAEFGNVCERCKHPHNPSAGYALTIHHLDNDKSNMERWNLAVLCQRCHLKIQGKVNMDQIYMLEHSEWFKPHLEGFMKSKGQLLIWPMVNPLAEGSSHTDKHLPQ